MVRMRWVGRVAVILMVALMCKKIGFTVRRETDSLGRTEEMISTALQRVSHPNEECAGVDDGISRWTDDGGLLMAGD